MVNNRSCTPLTVDMTNDPKAHGNTPKNGAPNVPTSARDGLNVVHTFSKKWPSYAIHIPSSSYTAKNGGTNDPTSSSNIPTSNLYASLSHEFDYENYIRSAGVLESKEEVKGVYDESANLSRMTETLVFSAWWVEITCKQQWHWSHRSDISFTVLDELLAFLKVSQEYDMWLFDQNGVMFAQSVQLEGLVYSEEHTPCHYWHGCLM
ncbi:hypothetical protein Tco_0603477 [Tanacetum coccineum]